MALELKRYLEATTPLEVELSGEDKLKIEYLSRIMTGNRLKAVARIEQEFERKLKENEAKEESEKEDDQLLALENYAHHLSEIVIGADIVIDGKKVPFSTPEERFDVFFQFEYNDLRRINSAIIEDIARPTKSGGTDSSDGQPPKEEELPETTSSG